MPLPTSTSGDGQITNPGAYGYDVLILAGGASKVGTYFQTARANGEAIQVQPLPPADVSPVTQQAEDRVPSPLLTFSRSDVSGGAGLRYANRLPIRSGDASKFWRSRGIDPRPHTDGAQGSVADSEAINNITAPVVNAALGYMVIAFDQVGATSVRAFRGYDDDVHEITDPLDNAPTLGSASETRAGNDVEGLVALNDGFVYALWSDDELRQFNMGTDTWAAYQTLTGSNRRLYAAKERLLVEENTLLKVVDGTNETTVLTLSTFITGLVETPGSIVVALDDGRMHFLVDVDGTLTVDSSIVLDGNRRALALAALGGQLFWVAAPHTISTATDDTRYELWRADINGTTLSNQQIVHVWGDPQIFDATDQFTPHVMTAGVNYIDVIGVGSDPNTGSGNDEWQIWRYHAPTGAVYHHSHLAGTLSNPNDATTWLDRTYFVTDNGGMYNTSSASAPAGDSWIIYPMTNLWYGGDKIFTAIEFDGDGTPVGNNGVEYTLDEDALDDPDHASWVALTFTATSGRNVVPILDANGEHPVGDRIGIKITTQGSRLDWMQIQGYPIHEEFMVEVPINVSDVRQRPNHKPSRVAGLGNTILTTLRTYRGQSVELQLLRESLTFRGSVEFVSEPYPLSSDRGSRGLVATLRLRGRVV